MLPPISSIVPPQRCTAPSAHTQTFDDYTPPPSHAPAMNNSTPETNRKRARIAEFVAHNTCAMVCYLWFGTPRPPPTHTHHQPYSPSFHAPPTDLELARLQFVPSKAFVDFMHKLLTTTQVSQSVIVLSLHYIYRLKCANPDIRVQEGSEMRLAVAALMLANKFLDDNTYTNLTWSQISHIALSEINLMEREFLLGVDFNLFVDQKAYEGWLLMLNGLMIAKEKDFDGQPSTNAPKIRNAPSDANSTSSVRHIIIITPAQGQPPTNPFASSRPSQPPPIPLATRPGAKRTANDAFSPRELPPNKRPVSMDVASALLHQNQYPVFIEQPDSRPHSEIPHRAEGYYSDGSHSACVEPTDMMSVESTEGDRLGAALGRMSLEPAVRIKEEQDEMDMHMAPMPTGSTGMLSAPYRPDERLAGKGVPKYLAFNTLVASPSVMVDEERHVDHVPPTQPPPLEYSGVPYMHQRKTVTRYHHPSPLPLPRQYVQQGNGQGVVRHSRAVQQQQQAMAQSSGMSLSAAFGGAGGVGVSKSARTSPVVGMNGMGMTSMPPMDVDRSGQHWHQPPPPPPPQRQHHAVSYNVPMSQRSSPTARLPALQTYAPNGVAVNGNSSTSTTPLTPTYSAQYALQQTQGHAYPFANAGPPGYQWRGIGNGFAIKHNYDGPANGSRHAFVLPPALVQRQ
ncbi:hypothetical protein FRB99_008663 [Tulasnella sp. 403]|nr:hypothetical protein FRB99_008663 [Tulasnella sp. 403]